MTKRILLLGLTGTVLDTVRQQLQMPDFEFVGGTGVDDVRSVFAEADVDHVILGGGLELETRAQMIRAIFKASDRATIHMKDQMSGPEGFLPFVRSVLLAIKDYEPHESPHAVLRAQSPSQSSEI